MVATEVKDKVLEFLKGKSQSGNPFTMKTEDIGGAVDAETAEVRAALGKLIKDDKISTKRGGPSGTQIYVGHADYFPATEPKVKARTARAGIQAAEGEKVVGTFFCVECGARNTLTERIETKCPRCNEVLLHPGKYCIYCGFPLHEER